MDLMDLQDLARLYARMGSAVQAQLDDLLSRWDIPALMEAGELNPNALPLMLPYLEAAAGLGADEAQEAINLIHEYERASIERRDLSSRWGQA